MQRRITLSLVPEEEVLLARAAEEIQQPDEEITYLVQIKYAWNPDHWFTDPQESFMGPGHARQLMGVRLQAPNVIAARIIERVTRSRILHEHPRYSPISADGTFAAQ